MKENKSYKQLERDILTSFNQTKHFINNKYYNIFLNSYDIKGVDYQQKDFILTQFWAEGRISTFKLKGTEGAKEHPQGLLVFTDFAPVMYNLYRWPIDCTLINTRGVDFIPATPQRVDKDIVIGYAQRNKKPVYFIVDYYAKKIALVESAIQMNILAQKCPWLLGTTPDNKEKMKKFYGDLLEDTNGLFIDTQTIDNIKPLITGAPYTIDKLYSHKCSLENELREYLGLDNLGVQEKKEHLINQEIEANNQIIEASSDTFLDCMQEFADKVKEVLNYDISFSLKRNKKEVKEIEKEEATNEDYEEEDKE